MISGAEKVSDPRLNRAEITKQLLPQALRGSQVGNLEDSRVTRVCSRLSSNVQYYGETHGQSLTMTRVHY